jgi:hypothetical protein
MLLYCDVAIGIYEVIDMHCSSLAVLCIGRNSCKCKYMYKQITVSYN